MGMCRKIKLWKLILLLVFVVISLQIFHMSLLSRLESKETREFKEFNAIILQINSKVKNPQRLDKSGTYHVVPDVLDVSYKPKTINSENITIVTQCSSNHLHHLVELTSRWTGPVSVSVLTYDTDMDYTMQSVAFYYFCNKRIRGSVTFHIVYPIDRGPLMKDSPPEISIDCDKAPVNTEHINYAIKDIEYPHNMLRNQAITYSTTTHILVIDIDMIPSTNLANVFGDIRQKYSFLSKSTFISRTAYVIPAFELKDGHTIPPDKRELLAMWDTSLIRPFYSEACWKCQKYTDYEKWRSISPVDSISYNVEWKDPWEPFFIASKSAPLYDERFKQYGFNRISQVCEMHVSGYQFTVLLDVFLIHKGFKHTEKFHQTKDKEQQKNRLLFRKFKQELKTKYDDSERRC